MGINIKIVLVINKVEREIKTMQKIQGAIKLIEPCSEVHILQWEDPLFIISILEIKPVLIMTFPFTAISTSYQFYILKYLLNCVMVCFRTEGTVVNTPAHVATMVGMEKHGVNLVDYEIFWGLKPAMIVGKELLKKNKISSMDRIKHFGWPYLEDYIKSVHELDLTLPHHISSKLEEYPYEKKFLLVAGFPLADYTPQDILNAGDIVDTTRDRVQEDLNDANQFVQRAKRFRQMWIDTFLKCVHDNPDILFVIKMHPIELIICREKKYYPYEVFENYNNTLLIAEAIPFRKIIPHCSISFHCGSTTMFEAYLSKVPTVFISSKELILEDEHRNVFSDLGVSSTISTDIIDVSSIVSLHAENPIQFEYRENVETHLKNVFDFKCDERFYPSKRIAKFLLSIVKDKPQSILSDDKYLINSIQKIGIGHVKNIIKKGILKINTNNFHEALEPYFNSALVLLTAGQIQIEKLQYLRSLCLYKIGFIEESIDALRQELSNNPDDSDSQNLYNQLQLTQKMVIKAIEVNIPKMFAKESFPVICPHCKTTIYINRKGQWICPCCNNNFVC